MDHLQIVTNVTVVTVVVVVTEMLFLQKEKKVKLLPDVDKVFKKYGTFPDVPLYSVDLLDEE